MQAAANKWNLLKWTRQQGMYPITRPLITKAQLKYPDYLSSIRSQLKRLNQLACLEKYTSSGHLGLITFTFSIEIMLFFGSRTPSFLMRPQEQKLRNLDR